MDITKSELENMQFVGLPLKVEHEGPARGRIVDQCVDPISGYTTVEFQIDDGCYGDYLIRMIREGELPDLSLCHNVYANPDVAASEWTKEPLEISLCRKGGREGTHLCRVECSAIEGGKKKYCALVSSEIHTVRRV